MAKLVCGPSAIAAESKPVDASLELGEGKLPSGNRIAWACRQLRKGNLVGRYGWRCDGMPRRMYLRALQVSPGHECEVLAMKFEGVDDLGKFARLSWADVTANDWYVVTQLELVR